MKKNHKVKKLAKAKSAPITSAKHEGATIPSVGDPSVKLLQDGTEAAAWASVHAAQEANRISRWGLIFLACTLFATICAAIAAIRSVQIAQSVVDSVNRPYLAIVPIGDQLKLDFSAQEVPSVKFRIKNIGGSAAVVDTYGARLNFEEQKVPKELEEWLGGSNIFVIEKDGVSPILSADYYAGNNDLAQKLLTEKKILTLRINFSYTDLSKRRRNVFFTNYFQAPPFNFFHSNYPPRIEEVEYEPYKWFQRKNKLRSSLYALKWRVLPWTKPKMP